ncbi:MAG TPA: hypothetical protein K8W04_11375, partial [Bacteroides reticulotermitis]|nr:hypothetical protein [Bacteroides reticulotermitis]
VEQLTHILWNRRRTLCGTPVAHHVKQEIEENKPEKRLLKSTNSCARYGLRKDLFGELNALFLGEASNSYRSSE